MCVVRIIKLISIIFLLVTVTFGLGGCDSSENDDNQDEELAGELICDDGIDNDGDTDIDCDDIDCILDPVCEVACDDIIAAYCDKTAECNGTTFEDCILEFDGFLNNDNMLGNAFDCEIIVELPTAQQCVEDIGNMDCSAIDNVEAPDSCFPAEACNVCESDEDCADGLFCFECIINCTELFPTSRCSANNFFIQCEDGLYRTQE